MRFITLSPPFAAIGCAGEAMGKADERDAFAQVLGGIARRVRGDPLLTGALIAFQVDYATRGEVSEVGGRA